MKRITLKLTMTLLLTLGFTSQSLASLYPAALLDNSTGYSDSFYLGAPDDSFIGIGGQTVTYDFGADRVIDGVGQDFNVYEVDYGVVEFGSIDVLVSLNGIDFFSVASSIAAVVGIPGDSAHSNDAFARSYDLFGSGLSSIQYIRIDGFGTGVAGGINGFDLDAVGAINYQIATATVPEPSVLALLGFGVLGLGLMRRRMK